MGSSSLLHLYIYYETCPKIIKFNKTLTDRAIEQTFKFLHETVTKLGAH